MKIRTLVLAGIAVMALSACATNGTAEIDSTEMYEVMEGDSLLTIAERVYADGTDWDVLYQANKAEIANPNVIYPGQMLKIPTIEDAPVYREKARCCFPQNAWDFN